LVGKADATKPPFDSTDQAELVMTLNDSLPELQEFGDAGGFCLVDLTPMGLGRDPEALVRASEETGVHVVMGTGIYHEVHHPDAIADLDDVAIAELLVKEITEGVGDTGIRAGIIGEQGTYTGPMTDREAVVFRASAMAAVETGVAVTTHTHLGRNALDQIDVLTSQGLDPDRIVIGHLDDGEPDLDLIREIINRGAWAQFDDIGYEYYTERLQVQMATDVVRAGKLRQLAEEELTDHVILGSDFGMQRHLQSRGGPGLVVMAEGFWTTAEAEGVPTEVLEQCMITNAATVLTMV
jgi:phosphotriesterase-related protein